MTRELALVVACCGAAFGRRARPVTGEGVDWSLFLRLARFHRVQGLVRKGVIEAGLPVPDEIAETLSSDAKAIAGTNLRAVAESVVLLELFETHGIPILFLKGVTLGELAYGNPTLKAAADVDLLVPGEAIEGAASILRKRGYRLKIPEGASDPARLAYWHRRRKESLWVDGRSGLAIDLHSRASDNAALIPQIGVHSARQIVRISRTALPTLAMDELFAYLCVHGASSAWFRLKWISDFAALIHGLPPADIKRLHERSQELCAYRAAGQALLLADTLFGSLEDTDLRERILRDRSTKLLFRAALRQLSSGREPTERRFGTWRIHWTQLLLKPGFKFKIEELLRQVRDAIG